MLPDARKLLADANDACKSIRDFTRGKDIADFRRDDLLRSGIYWKFTVVGEAMSQLRRLDEATFNRITESWRIVGFRNQIIHGYSVIDDDITWDIVQEKVPILNQELEQLLGE